MLFIVTPNIIVPLKNRIAEKQLPIFPKAPEQGIVRHINDLPFAHILHPENEPVF